MNPPLVSVIVPHYNMNDTLPRLLDSIADQTFKNLEVIVIDDGSRCDCYDIQNAYANKGLSIRLHEHGINKGTLQALITGITLSKGFYVCIASADDFLAGSEVLDHLVALALAGGEEIIHAGTIIRDRDTGAEKLWDWAAPFADSLQGEEIFAAYVHGKLRGHSLSDKLYKRELWLSVLEQARGLSLHFEGEDAFLSSLLLAYCRSYRSSTKIIHYYNRTNAVSRKTRSARYLVNFHKMLTYMSPHFLALGLPSGLVKKYEAGIILHMKERAKIVGKALLQQDSPEHAEFMLRLFEHVDKRQVEDALSKLASLSWRHRWFYKSAIKKLSSVMP